MINCPIHPGNKLKTEKADGFEFAICKCDVPNNRFNGQKVWQQPVKRGRPSFGVHEEKEEKE